MAQPVATFDSYDVVGAREDLSDIITDVSPEETVFFSKTSKNKATNALHEWQTDSLRSSANNAHIEGDDTVATARTATTRLTNYCQIIKDAVSVPDSDDTTDKAGRNREMDYQVQMVAKELRLDLERALFLNNAKVAGSSTVPREMAGMVSYINTNVSAPGDATEATGDGTDARVAGTPRALTQNIFDASMQSIWSAGGKPDACYLNADQMAVVLTFTGSNNARATIDGAKTKVINAVDVYMTPWGTVEFFLDREVAITDVFIVESKRWKVSQKRPFVRTTLAKTGDSTKAQIVGEWTLEACNEAASGAIYDLS